ncbi:dynamin family protein [Candidatus Sumerlaeota bacterium]|nr:dynamin family protein [Candidatus Sumerlaeota bacterium]
MSGLQAREGAVSTLDDLRRICREFEIGSLCANLDACARVLEDAGIVDVAVVGRFKAGKSSFLNSIFGRDVLPVAARPLTSVITRVSHGPSDRAVATGLDGGRIEIPLDRLAEFVTERQNPNNVKGVSLVDVEVANLAAYRGVRFVDTPGLRSVYAHNTRTSSEWLPRIGAALMAVSVDSPLSDSDIDLLRETLECTPEVSILMTKADLVAPDELEDVLAFVREQVDKAVAGPVQIFPYSVKPGFEALRRRVREYLLEQVAARHEEKSQEIVRYKVHSLAAKCREYLCVALSAAQAAQEARLELGQQLGEERRILATVRNELWLMSNDLKSRFREVCLSAFLERHKELTSSLAGELRAEMKRWKGNLSETAEEFEKWAKESVRNTLEPLSRDEGSRIAQGRLSVAQGSFSRVVRAFQDRLAEGIRKALGIDFRGAQFEAVVRQPKRPDVNIGWAFDTPLQSIWFLIPMWLFGPLVRRHFLRRLPWEVEKNLHRVAGQWSDAFDRSVHDLAGQAQDFILEEMNTIEALTAESQDRRPAIERAIATLGRIEAELPWGATRDLGEITRRIN